MTRSVQEAVEEDTFIGAFGRERLAVSTDARVVVRRLPADRRRVRLRLAGERTAGRRIERTLAAAGGQTERRGQRADQGQTEKRAVAKMGQKTRSLYDGHHTKPGQKGEIRISLFPAFAAISSPAPAHSWARCRRNSCGS